MVRGGGREGRGGCHQMMAGGGREGRGGCH